MSYLFNSHLFFKSLHHLLSRSIANCGETACAKYGISNVYNLRHFQNISSNSVISSLSNAMRSSPPSSSHYLKKLDSSTVTLGQRFASSLTPRFVGGKLKPYSSFKRRFKLTGSGLIRYMRPGRVHKRFNKSGTQLQGLAKTQVADPAWEKTMKRLGFTMRRF